MAAPLVLWSLTSPPPAAGDAGLHLLHLPFLRIQHLPRSVEAERVALCRSVVVTSVHVLPALATHRERLERVPFYAVGGTTARALHDSGFRQVEAPPRATARDLVTYLRQQSLRPDVFFPHGSRGGETVLNYLRDAAIPHYSPVVYRSLPRPADDIVPDLPGESPVAVVLGSPTAAGVWIGLQAELGRQVPICTLGPTTAAACGEAGLAVMLEAESGDTADLLRRLGRHFQPAGKPS